MTPHRSNVRTDGAIRAGSHVTRDVAPGRYARRRRVKKMAPITATLPTSSAGKSRPIPSTSEPRPTEETAAGTTGAGSGAEGDGVVPVRLASARRRAAPRTLAGAVDSTIADSAFPSLP